MAAAYGLDADALVASVARTDEAGVIAAVALEAEAAPVDVATSYKRCLADAHRDLVVERGDPTPHRMV